MKNILIILFTTSITLFSTIIIAEVKSFKNNGINAPIEVKNKSLRNRNNVTKEEYEWLKKELLDTRKLLRKLENSTDRIDDKIEGKIEKEIAEHIIIVYSELVRNSLVVLGFIIGLLSLFVSLIAGLVGIPKLHGYMDKLIRNTHEKYEVESEARIFNKVNVQLSHAFYLYYRTFFHSPEHPAFKSGVYLATWFSDGAIKNIERLPEGKEKDGQLMFSTLHRAYHYASESLIPGLIGSHPNQKLAISIVIEWEKFADKNYNNKDPFWLACRETIGWVYILLGNDEQKEEGMRLVEQVLEHSETDQGTVKEIVDNYSQIKHISKFEGDESYKTFLENISIS